MSLCDKIGGPGAIQSVVDGFYKHISHDPKICDFFKHIDMTKQSKRTAEFVTMACGGPKPAHGF